jgi:hypothetical protein
MGPGDGWGLEWRPYRPLTNSIRFLFAFLQRGRVCPCMSTVWHPNNLAYAVAPFHLLVMLMLSKYVRASRQAC